MRAWVPLFIEVHAGENSSKPLPLNRILSYLYLELKFDRANVFFENGLIDSTNDIVSNSPEMTFRKPTNFPDRSSEGRIFLTAKNNAHHQVIPSRKLKIPSKMRIRKRHQKRSKELIILENFSITRSQWF